MVQNSKWEILKKLKAAPTSDLGPRPDVPPLNELSLNKEEMIDKFTDCLTTIGGVVHRVKDSEGFFAKLVDISKSEGLTRFITSNDEIISKLNLQTWAEKNQLEIFAPIDFASRDEFQDVVFDKADAGITGADYAVAESGTLCLVHDKNQPRLVSLAPITHIAIVPVERLVPTYENATDDIFARTDREFSHLTFITGPSQTGDIQGVLTKGMHGPKTLIVILVG